MERVYCPKHRGQPCLLKIGTHPDRPDSYGRGYYVCPQRKNGACDFTCSAKKRIDIQHCEKHGEIVGIQVWDRKMPNRIAYMCSQKPSRGACGYFDIEVDKENQAEKQAASSQSVAPERVTRSLRSKAKPVAAEQTYHVPEPPAWDSRFLHDTSSSSNQTEASEAEVSASVHDSSNQTEASEAEVSASVHDGSNLTEPYESEDSVSVHDSSNLTEPYESEDSASVHDSSNLTEPYEAEDLASVHDSSNLTEPYESEDSASAPSPAADHSWISRHQKQHYRPKRPMISSDEESEVSDAEEGEDYCKEDEDNHSEASCEEQAEASDAESSRSSGRPDYGQKYGSEEVSGGEGKSSEDEDGGMKCGEGSGASIDEAEVSNAGNEERNVDDDSKVGAELDGGHISTDEDGGEELAEEQTRPGGGQEPIELDNSAPKLCDSEGSEKSAVEPPSHASRDETVDPDMSVTEEQDRQQEECETSTEVEQHSGAATESHSSEQEVPSHGSDEDWVTESAVKVPAMTQVLDRPKPPLHQKVPAATQVLDRPKPPLHQASASATQSQWLKPATLLPQPSTSAPKPAPAQPTPLEKEEREGSPPLKAEATFKVGYQSKKVIQQLRQTERLIQLLSHKLPDGGAALRAQRQLLYARIQEMKKPPTVNLSEIGRGGVVSTAGHKGLYAHAKMLTSGAVEQLHSSLEDCPTADTQAEDPPQLQVSLMPHQKHALAWMQWRESQTPSAGILADDMGLGKTLSMLSLVAATTLRHQEKEEWLRAPSAKEGLVKCAGTLVVCPASLMCQWAEESQSKFKSGSFRPLVYHGASRTRNASDFTRYDVVITTYNIVGIEGASCSPDEEGLKRKKKKSSFTTLFDAHWRRVILDEAHVIRNHKTGVSMGACALSADLRWAVTGTPIQNNLKDFYSLIKFIQLAPFDDYRVWKATVEQRGSVGMRRLNTLVSTLVLRRTKEEMTERRLIMLTNKEVRTHMVQLQEKEREVYQVLFQEAQKVMVKWLEEQGEYHTRAPTDVDYTTLSPDVARLVSRIMAPYLTGSRGRCVLGLLLRLRQCCCHLSLLTGAIKKAESDQDNIALEVAMSALALDSQGDETDSPLSQGQSSLPPLFMREKISTKIVKVLEELRLIQESKAEPVEKSIVVSQWTSMLNIVAFHLDHAGISHTRIDGTVPPKERQKIMEQFNSPRRNPSVMLLSLQAGGVGLNLIGANHVFMLDMHWNPALEVQASDRCHRVGQKRDVIVHKFVTEASVEEKILRLQEKKLTLAKNVLEGASEKTRARKNQNQLTLNDLKTLFDINSM